VDVFLRVVMVVGVGAGGCGCGGMSVCRGWVGKCVVVVVVVLINGGTRSATTEWGVRGRFWVRCCAVVVNVDRCVSFVMVLGGGGDAIWFDCN
jgi:hypothetical protein